MDRQRVIPPLSSWLFGAGYLVAYVALDALSYVQPLLKLGITPWNPDAGLTLAFLLIRGVRQIPWTAAAAFSAELLVREAPAPLFTLACASIIIAGGYGALALSLSHRGLDRLLGSRRAALEFSVGAALTAFVVAGGYAATFIVAGILPASAAVDAIARNWVGDLNGVLTVTPLLLAGRAAIRIPALGAHRGLIALQVAVLAGLLWLVLSTRPLGDLPLVYVLFAPVLWITLTWGITGACAATLLIQVGFLAGAGTRLDAGSLLQIQYFLVTLALTTLLLGAVLAERANALARVAAAEAEQRALLATAPDAVLATNVAGEITSANLAAQRLFGATEVLMLGSPLAKWLLDAPLTGPVARHRLSGMRTDGESFPVEIASVRLDPPARAGYLLIARDMSEHDHAQTELRERDLALSRAMRFAVAGELATALTHELNQPITALVSYLQAVEILVSALETRDSRLDDTLRKATREALRASDILKRLRDFYRGGAVSIAEIDLQALVADVLSAFTDRAVRRGVEFATDIRVTKQVCTDGIQLQMVLHNLIANSLDALAESEPGNRRIRITVTTIGEQLRILVSDSGPGVPPEIRRKLFEPFVTSKYDGMGLGLAISRSLLRSRGGELRLEPTNTAGACFLIELPVTNLNRNAA